MLAILTFDGIDEIFPPGVAIIPGILCLLILIFSVISAIGIIFRRKDVSQRDGFVETWRGLREYLTGYFKTKQD